MLDPFEIYAHFDDGDKKEFSPPKTIFTLGVPNAGAFPKTCTVGFLLAETADGVGHREVTQKAFTKLTEKMEAKKQEMMGSGVNPSDIDWGDVWEFLRNALYGFIKDQIESGINDDVFDPRDVSVDIASADFHWGDGTKLSPEATVEFRGHDGVYYLTYYWEIQTVASSHVGGGGVFSGGGVIKQQ